MKRFAAYLATITCVAASALAGHALAAGHTAAAPDPYGFGSSVAEVVQVQPIEQVPGGAGNLKQVKCAVAGAQTRCYVAR